MSPDAFRRLALFGGSATIFGALGALGLFISWPLAAIAFAGGVVGVATFTFELVPDLLSSDVGKHEADNGDRPDGALVRTTRRDIVDRAQAGRGDEEDDDLE